MPKERCPFPADFVPAKGDKVKSTIKNDQIIKLKIACSKENTHNVGDPDFGALQRIYFGISY